MAYDQNYYQQPRQPNNGRVAQRPGPPQGYQQAPAQQYSQQQGYDDYGQDGYGYDNNGYGQDYDGGYQDANGGRGGGYGPDMNAHGRSYPQNMNGGGRSYAPQNQNYPPQQNYYPNGRGGGMPPRPRGGAPGRGMQRPPPERIGHGGPQGRGGPMNGGPMNGRPMDGPMKPGPGAQQPRRPLIAPPKSPEASWDNPFPTFPGAKKKTIQTDEQEITKIMGSVDLTSPVSRPRTAGSKGSQDRVPQRGLSTDDYGRPSLDSQRSMPRGYPPQGPPDQRRGPPPRGPPQGPPRQDFSNQRRGPPPSQGYGGPRQNGYGDGGYDQGYGDDFALPQRSMTMPDNPHPIGMGNGGHQIPNSKEGPGSSAPYNGSIGRSIPIRPATATGSRPQPQQRRAYTDQGPAQTQHQYPPQDPYNSGGYGNREPNEPISEVYDSYYDQSQPEPGHNRSLSNTSEMPDFDNVDPKRPLHRRGTSIEAHIQPGVGAGAPPAPKNKEPYEINGNLHQLKPAQSQPDFRAQAQPQTAIFEMVGDAPPIPDLPQQGYQEGYQDGWGQQNGQYNAQQQGPPQGQGGYGPYDTQEPTFVPPPRSASAAPGAGRGFSNGPRPGFPNGPSPQGSGFQVGQQNGFPKQPTPEGGLPPHAPPVRAGLIPNSYANQQQNIKPPPVRNYGGVSPAPQQAPVQPINAASPAAAAAAEPPPQPVTQAEIDRLRLKYKNGNPNDNEAPLLFVKKLVEASEVIVARLPDQRARNKAREKYIFEATKVLKKLREQQHPDAMFYFADCYGRGALGLEVNEKEAFTLYQSAAKLGHPGAAYRTAVCCELGNDEGGGTRKDPLKAIQWYNRAATLGDTPAMYKMGMIKLKGLLGQPQNPREAVVWLKRAAERADPENPHALHELALLYEAPQANDSALIHDESYAYQLFLQAAELGYKFSQFRLGQAFEYGQFGCPIDPRQSIMWYSKAAVQDEHQAELALSGWYLTGHEGILQQSDTEAYLWARKAAMAKLAKAEYAMGYYSEEGIGTPKSLEDAKRWYWRAASQNFPKAREKLEELKRNGGKNTGKGRERISRSKGASAKNNEECVVM